MKSKSELITVRENLKVARKIAQRYRELTLTDLGEDDGFDYMADGICGNIYDAFEALDGAVDAVEEMIENMD